jgi:hypothetical protein
LFASGLAGTQLASPFTLVVASAAQTPLAAAFGAAGLCLPVAGITLVIPGSVPFWEADRQLQEASHMLSLQTPSFLFFGFPAISQLQGRPTYAPKAVRFRLGGVDCFDASSGAPIPQEFVKLAAQLDVQGTIIGALAAASSRPPPAGASRTDGGLEDAAVHANAAGPSSAGEPQQAEAEASGHRWVWESPVYPVQNVDVLQSFAIPPTLCVGGYLRVELLGKQQTQAIDGLYYGEAHHWLA